MPLDPGRRIELLTRALSPALRRAFLEAVRVLRESTGLSRLVSLIEEGRLEEAVRVSEAAARRLGSAWGDAYRQAGAEAAATVARALQVVVSFDDVNVRAVAAVQRNAFRLVREVTEEQRRLLRQVITRGVAEGLNPRTVARQFRSSIGLTARQEQAVANFRGLLETRSAAALTRQLRDRRFDPAVRAAVEAGEPLSAAQISAMVERYQERYLAYRATVIARTEALRAAHEGTQELYRQAVADGTLDPDTLERRWNTARDERVRTLHDPMHGQTRRLFEPFEDGAGNPLSYPGDVDAPPETTIQCRCAVGTRFEAA